MAGPHKKKQKKRRDVGPAPQASPPPPPEAERPKQRKQPSQPPPPPAETYLAATQRPSFALPPNVKQRPPVVALSPLNTLVTYARSKRGENSRASRHPTVRPYLATFLEYVCGRDFSTGEARFIPVVTSSLAAVAAFPTLSAIDLIPFHKLPESGTKGPYEPETSDGDVLAAVLTGKATCRFHDRDSEEDVPRGKDLSRVAVAVKLGKGGVGLTYEERMVEQVVLLEEDKNAAQPYNILPISPFTVAKHDLPSKDDTREIVNPTTFELDPDSLPSQDPHLLMMIYLLDRLRRETSIGSAIRGGFVQKIRDEVTATAKAIGRPVCGEADVDELLANRGRKVCEEQGIEIRREWDEEWREKILQKEGRKLKDGIPHLNLLRENALRREKEDTSVAKKQRKVARKELKMKEAEKEERMRRMVHSAVEEAAAKYADNLVGAEDKAYYTKAGKKSGPKKRKIPGSWEDEASE